LSASSRDHQRSSSWCRSAPRWSSPSLPCPRRELVYVLRPLSSALCPAEPPLSTSADRRGVLRVVISTQTLALGINAPARTAYVPCFPLPFPFNILILHSTTASSPVTRSSSTPSTSVSAPDVPVVVVSTWLETSFSSVSVSTVFSGCSSPSFPSSYVLGSSFLLRLKRI
jgi:hypothetical protein